MKSSNIWISLCGLLAAVCGVQATYTYYSSSRCNCNGRSRYCLRDAWGLHCVDCTGNTEGRHCERCKDGFYLKGAALSCTPCLCNPAGSVSARCDSRGRCSCREGVAGEKCDRCPDGPIGPNGCSQRRPPREDSGSLTMPCFCYGHSSRCSPQSGYSVHSITSTFADGPEGWKATTAQGVAPDNVHFRWSPKHQDLEVISKNSLPVYLQVPAPYLGNQLLSYGQNLSFSLRLDRGVRHPSTSDVILEGAGQRVSAALGDLRSIIPSGQRINYSFRLDEQPGSRWRPQLSSVRFQTLLQNLTAIRIRLTFGENGRGYLDNVQLVSAQRGGGVPARWVRTCSCPSGYEGDFCERCAAGFTRRVPADGAFSPCEPCGCRGGSCDPQTGDCYSADETTGELSCPDGFYLDPWQPRSCVKCPCPDGASCSLAAGSLTPRCDRCPPGTTGSRCDVCQEGFYGDPTGSAGVQRPCRPCQCNGHIDVSVAGSCDRISGDCLRCLNHTAGRSCEACKQGFYHSRAADACKPCDCDVQGSESRQCDDSGRCRCRPGFEGLRCQRSDCPACFSPIKAKMETYAAKLKDLETLFSAVDGGVKPANSDEMEAALKATEKLITDLQDDANQLTGLEKKLQARLSTISRSQLDEMLEIQNMADAADDIRQQQQTYKTKVDEVRTLIGEMKLNLDEAESDLRSAEVPLGDAPLSPNPLSSLVQTASSLADAHQMKADAVERTAADALSDSLKSKALMQNLMKRENKVNELIGDLNTRYKKTSAQVKGLEEQATLLSGKATEESKMADGMLKAISSIERGLPSSLKGAADAMVARLDGLKETVDGSISGFKTLQAGVQPDMAATRDLLADGKAAQQVADRLQGRVNDAAAVKDGALQRIRGSTQQLEDALNALRGFDQQIDGRRALADAAIKRLPGINGTIQQAVSSNAETLSILGDIEEEYDTTLSTIDMLKDKVSGLKSSAESLPPHDDLLSDATALNSDVMDLSSKAAAVAGGLDGALEAARRTEADAQQAAAEAAAALRNTGRARDALNEALKDLRNLKVNDGVVDEERLKQLEDSLADAQREVEGRLRPRLQDMEELVAAQERRLNAIIQDIDSVEKDKRNLQDILAVVPDSCFNARAIEKP